MMTSPLFSRRCTGDRRRVDDSSSSRSCRRRCCRRRSERNSFGGIWFINSRISSDIVSFNDFVEGRCIVIMSSLQESSCAVRSRSNQRRESQVEDEKERNQRRLCEIVCHLERL